MTGGDNDSAPNTYCSLRAKAERVTAMLPVLGRAIEEDLAHTEYWSSAYQSWL
jgi:hypothetical protein